MKKDFEMICPYCGGGHVVKYGFRRLAYGGRKRRFLCMGCKRKFSNEEVGVVAPKILLLDIETSRIKVDVFSLRVKSGYINPAFVDKDWFVISWAAKWLCKSEIMSDVVIPKKARERNDTKIIKSMWGLMDEADIIIAHNGKGFDIKKLNTRFILQNFPPPMEYKVVDTLQIARKHFAFTSNKLDYLCEQFGFPVKKDTDMQLWVDCESGDAKALGKMDDYCRNDVLIMEDVYMRFLPWINNHPNVGLYSEIEEPVCRNCGLEVQPSGRFWYTGANRYKAWRCDCGAVGRFKDQTYSKEKRKALTK